MSFSVLPTAQKLFGANNEYVSQAASKANELMRLITAKNPAGLPNGGDACKPVICLELACKILKLFQPFPKDKAMSMSGVPPKMYQSTLVYVQNLLKLRFTVTAKELAVQFGCMRLIPFVERTMEDFKAKFLNSLPESRRSHVDFSNPCFIASAFFLCANKEKLKIDKKKLILEANCSESEFNNISEKMYELCYYTIGTDSKKKKNNNSSSSNSKNKRNKNDSSNNNNNNNTTEMKPQQREEEGTTTVADNNEKEDESNNNNNNTRKAKRVPRTAAAAASSADSSESGAKASSTSSSEELVANNKKKRKQQRDSDDDNNNNNDETTTASKEASGKRKKRAPAKESEAAAAATADDGDDEFEVFRRSLMTRDASQPNDTATPPTSTSTTTTESTMKTTTTTSTIANKNKELEEITWSKAQRLKQSSLLRFAAKKQQ